MRLSIFQRLRTTCTTKSCVDLCPTKNYRQERCGIQSSGSFVRGTIVKSNFTLDKEWEISIDVKIDEVSNGWTSLFRLANTTSDGYADGALGSRIPAIFVHSQTRQFMIHHTSLTAWHLDDIGLGWHNVCITQRLIHDTHYKFQTKINGALVIDVVQTKPLQYENVNLYVSGHNFPPVKGEYRNLEFHPSPNNIVI